MVLGQLIARKRSKIKLSIGAVLGENLLFSNDFVMYRKHKPVNCFPKLALLHQDSILTMIYINFIFSTHQKHKNKLLMEIRVITVHVLYLNFHV